MMAAPALCTGCSGQFSRMARLFQVFQAFQGFLNCSKSSQEDLEGSKWFLGGLDVPGCNRMQLEESGYLVGVFWTVPEHLVLGKCWLASPIGTGSVKLMVGPGLK